LVLHNEKSSHPSAILERIACPAKLSPQASKGEGWGEN
jgi:hypothetical protein